MIRLDNIKVNNTLLKLAELFTHMNHGIIYNNNVDVSCLGKKGLHLNNHGTKIVAKNIISLVKGL